MNTGRREFLTTVSQAIGATALLGAAAGEAFAQQPSPTVGEVIDLILKTIPGAPFPKTVDTLKSGNASQKVTGIVTTMFATVEVIRKAIAANANFIIAHEPTFYNHLDETAWLEQDDVYKYKRDLLEKHSIAVWRFHDYIHSHVPDGVRMGVMTALGYEKYYDEKNPRVFTVPFLKLKDIVTNAKQKLGIPTVRVIGDMDQSCQRILLLPGASGGRSHIQGIEAEKPDVLIIGELSEWETAEYVRDARLKGEKLSLVVLGHAVSEEPGLEWMVPFLQPKVPGIKVTHVPSGNPFLFV
jgi:putative NIF3 family GTP cyclohydrolase 1 type 2